MPREGMVTRISMELSAMSRKEIFARIAAEINAFGYGAGTVAQTVTAIIHLVDQLIILSTAIDDTESSGNTDLNTEIAKTASLTLLIVALSASLCKGISYYNNSRYTNFELFSDLYDWLGHWMNGTQPENAMHGDQRAGSKERSRWSYLVSSQQLWGAWGGTAMPNAMSMFLQAYNIGAPFWVELALAMGVGISSAVSVSSLFIYVTQNKPVNKEMAAMLDREYGKDEGNADSKYSINVAPEEYSIYMGESEKDPETILSEKKAAIDYGSSSSASFWRQSSDNSSYWQEFTAYFTGGPAM